MRLDDTATDVEAETRGRAPARVALAFTRGRLTGTIGGRAAAGREGAEAREKLLLLLTREARPVVADAYLDLARPAAAVARQRLGLQQHRIALGRVMEGIAQQIDQHPGDQLVIGHHRR